MKIKRFAYHDKYRDWKLEPIDFDDLDLILLVGVSGVGKTKILEAIANLKRIAEGMPLNGIQWDITFEAENGNEYRWCGEYEITVPDRTYVVGELSARLYLSKDCKMINESIYINQELFLERHSNKVVNPIIYNGLYFSTVQSVLGFLEADELKPVRTEIEKIYDFEPNSSVSSNPKESRRFSPEKLEDFTVDTKIMSTYFEHPEIFKQIKKIFMDIFYQVEDIKMERVENSTFYILKFKERGCKKWFFIDSFSSGMFKILACVTDLFLIPEYSLILIDEFENSLGVNCLDSITEILNTSNRNLQFILTSHHPYIINNINMKSWRIVTRRGGVVTVKNARDLGLGRSKHDAFMQLINSDEYAEGIEMEEFESV
ncbi:MAG: AAA family ATPase [Spirulina sp.]